MTILIMIERAPDEVANRYRQPEEPEVNVEVRCILFDMDDDTGLKSVRNIIQGDYISQVVAIALEDCVAEKLLIDKHADGFIDLTPHMQFKQKRTVLKRISNELEAHFKTRLPIFPPDTRQRGGLGRFRSTRNDPDPRYAAFHECPTCKSPAGIPCRTPSGKRKEAVHDTRPFSLGLPEGPDEEPKRDLSDADPYAAFRIDAADNGDD